jgi:hypothetical protein
MREALRVVIFIVLAIALPLLIAVAIVRVISHSGGGKKAAPTTLVAAREVNVSHLRGPQSETSIAIDPSNARVLLAGSNDIRTTTMAVYSSTDGGLHWRAGHLPPPAGASFCEMSDPSVAINRRGRQYYTYLGVRCVDGHAASAAVYLATRRGPHARWLMLPQPVARAPRLTLLDDHPMLLVDNVPTSPHRGRLYVGWTRFSVNPDAFIDPEHEPVDLVGAAGLVSHSNDRGRHWSRPVVLSRHGSPLEVRLAAGPAGEIYAVWRASKTNSIYISSSDDGATFRAPQFIAASVVLPRRSCHRNFARIPAQPRRCVAANPVVSVDTSSGPLRGRVYVTYGSTSLNQSQDVYINTFDPQLRPLLGTPAVKQVNPREPFRGPDQFLPWSTMDSRTGKLWVCYYQSGRRGRHRRSARYACTLSHDGGVSWTRPRLVARVGSNETLGIANRANGYGDYEGVAASGGVAHAVWTDGREVRRRKEEVYTASLTQR